MNPWVRGSVGFDRNLHAETPEGHFLCFRATCMSDLEAETLGKEFVGTKHLYVFVRNGWVCICNMDKTA